jgi:quinol monooxygenase YgiN
VKIVRTAQYNVRPETLEACKAAQQAIVATTHAEPGTLMYLVLQSADDPTRFVHLSGYTDEAALATHVSNDLMLAQIRDVLTPAMVGEPQFTMYSLVDGKVPEAAVV